MDRDWSGWRRHCRPAVTVLVVGSALILLAEPALAHGGTLRGEDRSLSVPTWLFLATGAGAVGASFLLSSFVTDRRFVRSVHAVRRTLDAPRPALVVATRTLGVVGLVAVVAVGLVGPADPLLNLGVLLVWGAWWAGFAMTTYLVGNAWPALNPWRTLARWLPAGDGRLPDRLGAWPAVAGLLGLIWLEVVSPLADDPRLLGAVVAAYTVLTLAGAAVFEDWFERVDPVSRTFRLYGRVAPLGRLREHEPEPEREDEGEGDDIAPARAAAGGASPAPDGGDALVVRYPGAALTAPLRNEPGAAAFVVALLWATTFDGLVATPAWRAVAGPLVRAGLPAALLYPLALVAGFGLFVAAYRGAVGYGRLAADSYLPESLLARRFAPPLVAIAAGYHAAHYLGYFLSLTPILAGALTSPLAPPAPAYLVVPGWFGGVELAAVLAGHVLAVWIAHAVAYDLFPSRLQAVRSQYALTLVMICYTGASLFVVSQPSGAVPYL